MRTYFALFPVALADVCTPLTPQYGDVYEYNPKRSELTFSSVVNVDDPIWSPTSVDEYQWMEIPVPDGAEVVGVRTEGRAGVDEWVASYGVLLQEGLSNNHDIYLDAGNATGNSDGSAVVDHQIHLGQHGVRFSAARIVPQSWHAGISMKVSLLLQNKLSSGHVYPTNVPAEVAASAFSGVGLFRGKMRCTAFYIDTPDREGAYALSAGHCTQDFFSSAGVMPVVAEDKVWPIIFKVNSDSTVEVSTRRVEYATMQGMDVSLVQLNVTKQEMQEFGIRPFQLADALPQLGEKVQIVGMPSPDDTMQQVSCQHLGLADIGERFASWERVAKNDCAGIREGFSGSPMLDAAGRVYGIVGTTTIGAISETCAMGNPCEITASRPTGAQICNESNYGAQAVEFNGCFNESGFHSDLESCMLRQKIGTDRLIPTRVVDTPANNAHSNPLLLWQVEVPSGWTAVKYKQGLAHATRCEDEDGYSEEVSVSDSQPLKNISMIDQEGLHRFCLIGQKSGADFQPFDQSTYFVTYIDKTVPTRIPLLASTVGSKFSVEPIFDVPEAVDFKYYLPEAETGMCPQNTISYRRYMRFPFQVDLEGKRQAPICLQGSDYAGHWAAVYRYVAVNSTAATSGTKAAPLTIMV